MKGQSFTEDAHSFQDTIAQQAILQQAEAVVSAEASSASSPRQDTFLQEIDLLDASADGVSPPTYGDIYGEIRDEKNGLGARITDDGRVNIRVNHFNRRLSQIFTPALHQHVQSIQNDHPPPLPYIPRSLGGEEGVPPPPPLNVVIQIVGSRGDVQPFIALGKVLKDTYGHRVRLATHPNFKEFVLENGLEFFSIGGDPSQLMAFMVKNPGLMPGFHSLLSGDVGQRRRDVAEYIQGCWRSCYQSGDGMAHNDLSEPAAKPFVADCIIANPPSFAHIHCAEKLGIPLHIMFTMPYSPTQSFPHPLANIQSSNADPQLTNYISYAMIEVLMWQGLGDIINRFRAKCLGLDPVSLIWAPGMLQRLKVPHTYCWSPALIAKPKDWAAHISISGFHLLNLASNYTSPPDLQAFLDAGPPPVYIGFGSIVLANPDAMTELIFEAVRKTGQRVLLSKGWGGIGADKLYVPDGVFMLGNVPHDWLFKHVSCVVHHGGAGTMAAGITAGRPTVIVPFFGDQSFWGAMVARAGAGPDPIPFKQLTADKLAAAITFCLKSESLERAKELASSIADERGSDTSAQFLHQHLEVDRLRCIFAPSRAATWRIKRTQVRLSAFAACTLANADLIDFHDLKRFRPQEYSPDEGPWDPITGFSAAVFGAISSMALGVADLPAETWRGLLIPFGSNGQQSKTSAMMEKKSKASSHLKENLPLTPPSSPERSQTSLSVQESRDHIPSPPSPPRLSTPTSKVSSGKDYDMMRQSGVHTSKGFGRIVKAALHSPIDLSMSITEGFHNAPKLWGDDTVRSQHKVTDLKSGAQAIGKEFAFGWYDGITGLVTQPWKGAQKEGTSGFFKGVGKGIGGFVTKPGAALFGIPAYFMKGVHKEVQKMFGSTVQNYIIASRVAQGYDEWLQSSDAEKKDVIDRWKLIQKHLKAKRNSDEMLRDMLDVQRRMNSADRDVHQDGIDQIDSTQSINSAELSTQGPESTVRAKDGTESPQQISNQFPEEELSAVEINKIMRLTIQNTSQRDIERDNWPTQENNSHIQSQRQETAGHLQANQENLSQVMAISEDEAQQHTREALEYEEQLKRAIAKSLREQRRSVSDSEWESATHRINDEDEGVQQTPLCDARHLGGTTQREFVAQKQQEQHKEKTTQEKAEEEIVMEYVKKQSLLEQSYQYKGKGKGRAMA